MNSKTNPDITFKNEKKKRKLKIAKEIVENTIYLLSSLCECLDQHTPPVYAHPPPTRWLLGENYYVATRTKIKCLHRAKSLVQTTQKVFAKPSRSSTVGSLVSLDPRIGVYRNRRALNFDRNEGKHFIQHGGKFSSMWYTASSPPLWLLINCVRREREAGRHHSSTYKFPFRVKLRSDPLLLFLSPACLPIPQLPHTTNHPDSCPSHPLSILIRWLGSSCFRYTGTTAPLNERH